MNFNKSSVFECFSSGNSLGDKSHDFGLSILFNPWVSCHQFCGLFRLVVNIGWKSELVLELFPLAVFELYCERGAAQGEKCLAVHFDSSEEQLSLLVAVKALNKVIFPLVRDTVLKLLLAKGLLNVAGGLLIFVVLAVLENLIQLCLIVVNGVVDDFRSIFSERSHDGLAHIFDVLSCYNSLSIGGRKLNHFFYK